MRSLISTSIFAFASAYQLYESVPFESTSDDIVTFGPKAIPEFAAGLVYGFTDENDLDEFALCLDDAHMTINDAEKVVHDLTDGNLVEAILALKHTVRQFHETDADCHATEDDSEAVKEWAAIFEDVPRLTKTIGKNYALHRKHIDKDIDDFKELWRHEEYFGAGLTVADLVYYAVGPVHGKHEVEEPVDINWNNLFRTLDLFTGGFVKAFAIENQLDEFITCFNDIHRWFHDCAMYANALGNLKLGQAIFWLAKSEVDIQPMLSECMEKQDDKEAIAEWETIFHDKPRLFKTVAENKIRHKKELSEDMQDFKWNWANGHFFKAGEIAADIVYYAIGPVYPDKE